MAHEIGNAEPAPTATWGRPGGYGPAYPPAGYGPPAGCPPCPPVVRPTNALAIMALVSVFVCAPAAIVFGIVARNQIARTGEDGSGLALAGLIAGSIITGLAVLYILFVVIVVGATLASIPAT